MPIARRRIQRGRYPSTPVGGPIEAVRVNPPIEDIVAYPSTPVGGPIEAPVWGRRHGKGASPIRRLLSAAPLKRIVGNAAIGAHRTYPSTPVGGPIEARSIHGPSNGPLHLSVDSCRRPH